MKDKKYLKRQLLDCVDVLIESSEEDIIHDYDSMDNFYDVLINRIEELKKYKVNVDKYSSCCGVQMSSGYEDRLICPECKEHCSAEEVKPEPDWDIEGDRNAELNNEEGKV